MRMSRRARLTPLIAAAGLVGCDGLFNDVQNDIGRQVIEGNTDIVPIEL